MTLDGNDFLDITLDTCSIKEKKNQASLKLKASYLSESLLWELGGNMPYFVSSSIQAPVVNSFHWNGPEETDQNG